MCVCMFRAAVAVGIVLKKVRLIHVVKEKKCVYECFSWKKNVCINESPKHH